MMGFVTEKRRESILPPGSAMSVISQIYAAQIELAQLGISAEYRYGYFFTNCLWRVVKDIIIKQEYHIQLT